jgi:hypothetical protein
VELLAKGMWAMGGWEVEVTESRLLTIPDHFSRSSERPKDYQGISPASQDRHTVELERDFSPTLSWNNFNPSNSNRHHIRVKRLVFAYHWTLRTPQSFNTSLRINSTVLAAIQISEGF